MPSKVFDTVWEAEPHTLAKIAILKAYLKAWLAILGQRKPGQPVLYIDGFAGPGEYTNHPEGSPLAALAAAREVIHTLGPRWAAGLLHCVFIEENEHRCENLKCRLAGVPDHPKVRGYVFQNT